jgi:hypothetical protein
MAYYAFLDENNIVVDVIVGIDSTETIDNLSAEEWYSNFRGQVCKETSIDGEFRKQYAGIGYSYDPDKDIFISPHLFPSWSLDSNCDWQPPVPQPDDNCFWDEQSLSWIVIEDF